MENEIPQSEMVTNYIDMYTRSICSEPANDAKVHDYLVSKVQNATLESKPFPYLQVFDFLPPDLYQKALRAWPLDAEFNAVKIEDDGGRMRQYVGSRKAIMLDASPVSSEMNPISNFWYDLSQYLKSHLFVETLFNKLSTIIEPGIASLEHSADDHAGYRMYVCRDEGTNDALGTHLDATRKLVTIVVYLGLSGETNQDSQERWGTALYETGRQKIRPLEFSETKLHKSNKVVKFIPNSAFIMPNSKSSLHGVVGGQKNVVRKTIMCGYWMFND